MATPHQRLSETEAVSILNGQSLSAGYDMRGRILVGIFIPGAWTAAGLSFQVSPDNTNWSDLWDEAAEVTALAAASRYVGINPQKFLGVNFIKIRSGTSGVPVAQGAQRDFTLMTAVPAVA